jgi:hypothetical protein
MVWSIPSRPQADPLWHAPRSDRLPEVLLAGSPQVALLLVAETLGPIPAQPAAQAATLMETLAALLRRRLAHARRR